MTNVKDGELISLPDPWSMYSIDSRPEYFDVDAAWDYLHNYASWGRDRTRDVLEMNYGLFTRVEGKNVMIGMTRIAGDGTVNLIMDVYILPLHQGGGLGAAFLRHILEEDGMRESRWLLYTGDRKDWYVNKLEFKEVGRGDRQGQFGMPDAYYILERDGKVIEAERNANK